MEDGLPQTTCTNRLESYRLLAESAADALIGADSRGRVILWNRAAAEMFGYDADTILGAPVS